MIRHTPMQQLSRLLSALWAVTSDATRMVMLPPRDRIAEQVDIGHELHFHGNLALTFAFFAPATINIKRKISRFVSPYSCLGSGCKKFSYQFVTLYVADRI